MNALDLWQILRTELPNQASRVAHQCEPVTGSARDLLELLDDRHSGASIASEKCGYYGNPYGQLSLDFFKLVTAARTISGQKGRPKWERPA
jgi:hypothetical protein